MQTGKTIIMYIAVLCPEPHRVQNRGATGVLYSIPVVTLSDLAEPVHSFIAWGGVIAGRAAGLGA